MKKWIAFLMLLLALPFSGCMAENATLEQSRTYSVETQIRTLVIQVGAAELTITQGAEFSVTSNLKFLSVTEDSGELRIIDTKTAGVTYNDPVLSLQVPANTVFDRVEITCGAGKLSADLLTAEAIKFQLGAGDLNIGILNADVYAEITGGAGEINISGGTIRGLSLSMGTGTLNLTAQLLGDNQLTLLTGESNVTLLGGRELYTIGVEKGIGSITVDAIEITDSYYSGSGENKVQIEGGIGRLNLLFDAYALE